jgi:hypothetical protein
MAKNLSVREKIAQRQMQKSLEDKIYEVFSGLSDAEADAAKSIIIDLFDLKASDVSAAAKKEYSFAKPVVVEAKPKAKAGRKPAAAKAVKAAKATESEVKEVKKAAGRGRKGKYPTIHEDELRNAVMSILRNTNGELSAKEIREMLYKGAYAEHRENPSFQTRFSSLLKNWVKEGLILHGSRGIYSLAKA